MKAGIRIVVVTAWHQHSYTTASIVNNFIDDACLHTSGHSVHSQPFKTLICCTLWAAELICMWKQPLSKSCCCINSCSIVCVPWSNCLFAFSPELTCCGDSVPSTITSQAGNPSSNPSRLWLPLLIPSQVQSLAPILVDVERQTAIRIWGLFYWSFSSLKGS